VVQQTKVDFPTPSETLDAYHGDVADTIIALACGPGAAAARDDDIIQASVSSCDASPLDLSVAEQVRLCHDSDGHPSKNKHREIFHSRKGRGYPPNFLELLKPSDTQGATATGTHASVRFVHAHLPMLHGCWHRWRGATCAVLHTCSAQHTS
jgi:hypothetical protein